MAVTSEELIQLFCHCGKRRILTGDYAQCSSVLENWMQSHGGLVPVDPSRFKRAQRMELLPVAVRVGRRTVTIGRNKSCQVIYSFDGHPCIRGGESSARVRAKAGWVKVQLQSLPQEAVSLQTIEDARRRSQV